MHAVKTVVKTYCSWNTLGISTAAVEHAWQQSNMHACEFALDSAALAQTSPQCNRQQHSMTGSLRSRINNCLDNLILQLNMRQGSLCTNNLHALD